jgi:hypothetical protein
MEPSIRPDVTSALAANAARRALISDDSGLGGRVVVGVCTSVVGEATVVVDTTAAVVVVETLSAVATSSEEDPPSVHADTTSAITAKIMMNRLATGLPFLLTGRGEAYVVHRLIGTSS